MKSRSSQGEIVNQVAIHLFVHSLYPSTVAYADNYEFFGHVDIKELVFQHLKGNDY